MRKKASKISGNGIIRRHQRLINKGDDTVKCLSATALRKKQRMVKKLIASRLLDNPGYLINFRSSMR